MHWLATSLLVIPLLGVLPVAPTTARSADEQPTTSVRTDILPGVELTVEEVEPGIYYVLHDGIRVLAEFGDVVVGDDDSIWVLDGDAGFFRLGEPTTPWPNWLRAHAIQDFRVGPDGTVWLLDGQLVDEDREGYRLRLSSYEDGSWTVHREGIEWTMPWPWTVAPDGTIWAALQGPGVARLGAEEWEPLEGAPTGPFDTLRVTRDGEVWLVSKRQPERLWRYRQDAGEWEALAVDTAGLDIGLLQTTVMDDGTIWVAVRETTADGERVPHLLRYDGDEWQRWGPSAGVPTASSPDGRFRWRDLEQAPDGALWVSYVGGKDGEHTVRWYTHVERFDVDGSTWQRFGPGLGASVKGAVTGDGSVWLHGGRPAHLQDGRPSGLYVITPEAVASAE